MRLRWTEPAWLSTSTNFMLIAGLLLAGLLLASCDWRQFDDVLAKAPVLSFGPPDGFASRDVGRVILPLAVPADRASSVSARFLVAGTEAASLAVVDIDSAGRAHPKVASKTEIADMAGEANAVIKSAVQLSDGRIVLGTPSYSLTLGQTMPTVRGRVYFLKLIETLQGMQFELVRGDEPGERIYFGLGVAAGKVMGPAEDLLVASLYDVVLMQGGVQTALVTAAPTCALALDETALEKYRFRALVTGQFIEGGTDEVAVGVPREGAMPGRVVILSRGAGVLDCPVTLQAPSGLPRFGNAIAAADFTGDGKLDLLIGAPPSRAFLFAGPFVPGVPATPLLELRHPTIPDTGATGDFGYRVLGVDLDGVAGPEILVSGPELPAGSETGAGRVFAFKRDGSLFAEIADNSPQADASFGYTLAGPLFKPTGCGTSRPVLVVGAIKEVFTFFRVPGGPPDPRCL